MYWSLIRGTTFKSNNQEIDVEPRHNFTTCNHFSPWRYLPTEGDLGEEISASTHLDVWNAIRAPHPRNSTYPSARESVLKLPLWNSLHVTSWKAERVISRTIISTKESAKKKTYKGCFQLPNKVQFALTLDLLQSKCHHTRSNERVVPMLSMLTQLLCFVMLCYPLQIESLIKRTRFLKLLCQWAGPFVVQAITLTVFESLPAQWLK